MPLKSLALSLLASLLLLSEPAHAQLTATTPIAPRGSERLAPVLAGLFTEKHDAGRLSAASRTLLDRAGVRLRSREGETDIHVVLHCVPAERDALMMLIGDRYPDAAPRATGITTCAAWLPATSLHDVAGLAPVRLVEPLPMPDHDSGPKMSEGVRAMNAEPYLNRPGKPAGGAGIRIAVIDVGFENLDTMINEKELPSNLEMIEIAEWMKGEESHGSACAEVIHDVAPGAELVLIRVGGVHEISDAIDSCIARDVDIISTSLSYSQYSFYDGTGPFSDMAERVREKGMIWVGSAGNYARAHWSGSYRDADADGWVDVGPNGLEMIPIRSYQNVVVARMNWNQYPSATADFDLHLFYRDGSEYREIISSTTVQDGNIPPTEMIGTYTEKEQCYLGIRYSGGEPPTPGTRFHIFGQGNNIISFQGPIHGDTVVGSMMDPSMQPSVVAVGAVYWQTGELEPYSSQGPVKGMKPQICGPTRVSTGSYDSRPFSGTSAAAPHVAGALALLMQEYPDWSGDDLLELLYSTALNPQGLPRYMVGAGRTNLPAPSVGSVHDVAGDRAGEAVRVEGARRLWLQIDASSRVRLRVVSMLGAELFARDLGTLDAGAHTIDLDEALTAGGYCVVVERDGRPRTHKVMVIP